MINKVSANQNNPSFKGLMVIKSKTKPEDSPLIITTDSIFEIEGMRDKDKPDVTLISSHPFIISNENGARSLPLLTVVHLPITEVMNAYKQAEKDGTSYLYQA